MSTEQDTLAPFLPYADGAIRLAEERGEFAELADAMQATCLIPDPWSMETGHMRFHNAPLVFSPEALERIYAVAAAIGRLFHEAMTLLWEDRALLERFYPGLTPFQKLMWFASEGAWHGFARMDLFLCADGRIQVCEMNADTPSGQTDALVPGPLLLERYPELEDPNADYRARMEALVRRVYGATTGREGEPRRVGIVYPTDLSEDLSIIWLYQQWFEEMGAETVLGSPYNMGRAPDGGVHLFGREVDFVLRHYKTDWWGERLPVWKDEEPFPDPDPLTEPLLQLIAAEREGHTAVLNPWGSIMAQNKLTLAFFWEEMERFSAEAQATIRAHIPETRRLDVIGRAEVAAAREAWVLKSDFGCEGDEVVIGRYVTPELWARSVEQAVEGIWVVQRYFEIEPLDGVWCPNLGVYLIAGAPSGLLVRLDPLGKATGTTSRVVAPLVDPSM